MNSKINPNFDCQLYIDRALKDQGYESDSTLVFRKKDNGVPSPLSPVEQKQAYLNLQAGGEAPVQGFRKHAPEKPKGKLSKQKSFLGRVIFVTNNNQMGKPVTSVALSKVVNLLHINISNYLHQ